MTIAFLAFIDRCLRREPAHTCVPKAECQAADCPAQPESACVDELADRRAKRASRYRSRFVWPEDRRSA